MCRKSGHFSWKWLMIGRIKFETVWPVNPVVVPKNAISCQTSGTQIDLLFLDFEKKTRETRTFFRYSTFIAVHRISENPRWSIFARILQGLVRFPFVYIAILSRCMSLLEAIETWFKLQSKFLHCNYIWCWILCHEGLHLIPRVGRKRPKNLVQFTRNHTMLFCHETGLFLSTPTFSGQVMITDYWNIQC